jgi:hypothetical protein
MIQPRLKKSETLEIRLPYPTKLAFMARCRDEGRTASEALRGFIDGAVEPRRMAKAPRKLIAGAAIAAAVGAIALPSLAHPARAQIDRLAAAADFARLDTNHDGRLTLAEFTAARR